PTPHPPTTTPSRSPPPTTPPPAPPQDASPHPDRTDARSATRRNPRPSRVPSPWLLPLRSIGTTPCDTAGPRHFECTSNTKVRRRREASDGGPERHGLRRR